MSKVIICLLTFVHKITDNNKHDVYNNLYKNRKLWKRVDKILIIEPSELTNKYHSTKNEVFH